MNAGSSPIPSRSFLQELEDDELRDGFVADHVRTRLALLIRTLREQRGWSQADLARAIRTTQSVVSRLEDPDYGKLSLRTLFEVASAFKLPVYIDMADWDEWFRLMENMSKNNLTRHSFDSEYLVYLSEQQNCDQAVFGASGSDVLGTNTLQVSNSLLCYASTSGYGMLLLSDINVGAVSGSSLVYYAHHSQGIIELQPNSLWEAAVVSTTIEIPAASILSIKENIFDEQPPLIGQSMGLLQ